MRRWGAGVTSGLACRRPDLGPPLDVWKNTFINDEEFTMAVGALTA